MDKDSLEATATLIRSALGVFDHVSVESIRRIRQGRTYSQRATVKAADLTRMLATIEKVWPGLIDDYIDYRLQQGGK